MQLGSLHNCKLNDGNSAFGQAENILIFGKSAVESSGERRVARERGVCSVGSSRHFPLAAKHFIIFLPAGCLMNKEVDAY